MDRARGDGLRDAGEGAGALVWRVGLHAAGLLAVLAVLWRGALVVQLLAVAAVLAAALETPVGALVRRRWRRGWAILSTMGAAVVVLGGLVAAVAPAVVSQGAALAEGLPALVSSVEDSEAVRWADRRFDVLERAGGELKQRAGTIASSVLAAATGAVSFVAGLVTVIALTAFLLTSFPALWRQALRWARPERRPRLERRGRAVRAAVAGYVGGALVMGAIAGVVTGVTTALLGVPYALALAALTALLGIVPFVGAIVSGAIVVLVTFLALGWKSGLVALAVFVAYQQLEGAVLQRLVQRRTVALNPLVVIAAALLGTAAGGVFGGVMALPLAAAGQVILGDALRERERERDGEGKAARERELGAR